MPSLPDKLPSGAPEFPDTLTLASAVSALANASPRFTAMIALGVSKADALSQLGLQLFTDRKFAEAASLFGLAAALTPHDFVAWMNYGAALDSAGSLDQAATCLERSLTLAPRQPDTWLLLGTVRKKLADFAAAESAFRTALDQDPNSSSAWLCLALLQDDRREYQAAIESFSAVLKFGGPNADIAANLGKLHYQSGQIAEACAAYGQAVALNPENSHYAYMAAKARFVHNLILGASVEQALVAYRASCPPSAPDAAETNPLDLLRTAFGQLSGFGHRDAARRVGRRCLELDPASATIRYLLHALDADSTPAARAPDAYLIEYFDSFAEHFDAKLVGTLGYDVPEKLCAIVRDALPAGRKVQALDAGCGTGLCGALLKPHARQLTGLDLSPKMLEQARKRDVYDHLVRGELMDFLARSPAAFDLIVAADVLIYIGNLEPLFAAAANALRPGGLFAFSTESSDGEAFRLLHSGRFAHSSACVRSFAPPHFIERLCADTTVRLEAAARVPGNLFLFQRRP